MLCIRGNDGRGKTSSISLQNVSFVNERVIFLIDTGFTVNLIKVNSLNENVLINKTKIFNLVGINSKMIKTLGEFKICIQNTETLFQVVTSDLLIKYQGILGINFLRQHRTILNFIDDYIRINNVDIPFQEGKTVQLSPRSKTLVKWPVKKGNLNEGYIPRIPTGPGIYGGNCLVTKKNTILFNYS